MRALIVTTRNRALKNHASHTTGRHKYTVEIQFWWSQLALECLRGQRFDLVIWEGEPPDVAAYEFIQAHCVFATTLQIANALVGAE